MDLTREISTWIGLISSIVGIVLALVAIGFAILVDRSARQVASQTIRSLQKIETEVERLSTDTRELIKAGWDRMLGAVHPTPQPEPDGIVKDIAAGVAAELREELSTFAESKKGDQLKLDNVDELTRDVESSVIAGLHAEAAMGRPSTAVDYVLARIRKLSPAAQALALALATGDSHLTRKQYAELKKGSLAGAMSELRGSGLLVPLRGLDKEGKQIPVYYFSPGLTELVRAILPSAVQLSDDTRREVEKQLTTVDYRPPS